MIALQHINGFQCDMSQGVTSAVSPVPACPKLPRPVAWHDGNGRELKNKLLLRSTMYAVDTVYILSALRN